MLAVLGENAVEQGVSPRVRQADTTSFEPDREYALAIVPFRAFLHNTTRADQQAALRKFRRVFRPDGRLALSFFVPRFTVSCERYGDPQRRTIVRDDAEYELTGVTEIENELEPVVKAERTIERDGEVVRSATFRLALVSKRAFELLLETTGWSEWEGDGGFDGEPLDDEAAEMVWIARP